MRRAIAILMLLMLPLHFTWVAASPYCQHESGLASRHFGHHFHVHKAAQQDSHSHQAAPKGLKGAQHDAKGLASAVEHAASTLDQQKDHPEKVQGDPDCTVCHLGAGQLPSATIPFFLTQPPSDMVPGATRRLSSVHLPLPERPNWPDSL